MTTADRTAQRARFHVVGVPVKDNLVTYYSVVDDGPPAIFRTLEVPRDVLESMDCPSVITVTVESGDRLNEPTKDQERIADAIRAERDTLAVQLKAAEDELRRTELRRVTLCHERGRLRAANREHIDRIDVLEADLAETVEALRAARGDFVELFAETEKASRPKGNIWHTATRQVTVHNVPNVGDGPKNLTVGEPCGCGHEFSHAVGEEIEPR